MKIIQILSLFFLLSLIACKKETVTPPPSCTATSLKEVIVGTWTVKALEQNIGQVEFKADGTLVDPDGGLIGGSINGVDLNTKTYSVDGNTKLKVKAANGATFMSTDYTITSFSCNEFKGELLGIAVVFIRK